MKTLQRAALFVALLFATNVCGAEAHQSNTAVGEGRAAKMILVTFTDRSINRVGVGVSGEHYRRRGYYQKSLWSSRIAGQISADYRLTQINEWPIGELGVYCVVYEIPGDKTQETVLETLRHDARIESAQPMHIFHTMGSDYNDPYFGLQSNLRAMHIEAAHRRATGRNVKIAVIDTGVDYEHPDFGGRISEHLDFTASGPERFTGDIHGTAIAGALGAAGGNGRGIVGVAPDAEIWAYKACWQAEQNSSKAVCNSLTLALALNTAIRSKPQIINMSLTGPADPLLRQLLEHAMAKGITVVAAGAIDGADGFPASLPGVIAVESMERPHLAVGAGPRNYVYAPGMEILTTFPRGTYNFISGSSIAAAEVSGVIALLLELRPGLSSDELANVLTGSAQRMSNGGKDAVALVNAENAIEQLAGINYAAAE